MSNSEIELDLSWSKKCILYEISITPRVVGGSTCSWLSSNTITGVTFQKYNAKFYVLVATLSINENIKCLENTNQGL